MARDAAQVLAAAAARAGERAEVRKLAANVLETMHALDRRFPEGKRTFWRRTIRALAGEVERLNVEREELAAGVEVVDDRARRSR